MKKLLQLLTISGILISCSSSNSTFTLTNPSNEERIDEPVVLSRSQIEEKTGSINGDDIPVPYFRGEALPSQVDDLDRDGEWDELAFLMDFAPASENVIEIRFTDANTLPEFTERTSVHLGVINENGVGPVEELTLTADELPIPMYGLFQMDGMAWENDKVGFRQYFDGRNGRDIYGKTVPGMALDTVGLDGKGGVIDNYHVMNPWGRDILAVGNSTGIGGPAILKNGEPVQLGVRIDADRSNIDTSKFHLIHEGPVRSIFETTYIGWHAGKDSYTLKNRVEIWGGKYGYTNTLELAGPNPIDTLLVGLVNINFEGEPALLDESAHSIFYTHEKQTYDDIWFLGLGLIFPSKNFLGYTEAPDSGPGLTNSYLNQFKLRKGEQLVYHVFFGWELSDERFTDSSFFEELLETETRKLAQPIMIE